MIDLYENAGNLEEIAQRAVELVRTMTASNIVINFTLRSQFPVRLLAEPQLLDTAEKAREWQSIRVPNNFYFTHGEFIGSEGIPHITQELRRKPDSNRALASLISQKHVLGSGDGPLPSLLVRQASILDNILYLTVVFRALEVSKFFRINLEEIRLIAERIHIDCRNFTRIALCVFAFRAYINKDINTLEKCEIDLLTEGELIKRLEKKPHELAPLIRAKAQHHTMASADSVRLIANILDSKEMSADMSTQVKSPRIRSVLARAVSELEKYADLRLRSSHDFETDLQSVRAVKALEEFAGELEKLG